MMKHILNALLGQSKPRHKLIIWSEGRLKLHRHAGHHSVHTLLMHLRKTQAALLQKQMAGMFAIVQVIGIVHDTLDVALIIAHLHPRLKNILRTHNGCKDSIYLAKRQIICLQFMVYSLQLITWQALPAYRSNHL